MEVPIRKILEGQPIGCEIVARNLKVASDDHAINAAHISSPIFDNVPRRQRSKQGILVKETTKVVGAGDHKNDGHLSGNYLNKRQRVRRKRKSKALADSSDFEVIIPQYRPRGRRRVPADFRNSTTPYRKLDSRTFESYLEDIWSGFPEERRNSFTILDSLWFSLYMQNSSREKVLNWVKRKKIFSKEYVMVPIVMWSH